MRSTNNYSLYKNTEFRFFLDYVGPVVTKDLLKDEHYNNFLMLHSATRILSPPDAVENVPMARPFMNEFVRQSPGLYNRSFVTLNIHTLTHIGDDVENTSLNLNQLNAFPYENHLGSISRTVTNPNRVLAQYCRKLHAQIEIIDHVQKIPNDLEILEQQGADILKIFNKQQTLTTKHPNNTAMLLNRKVVEIVKILHRDNGIYVRVKPYLKHNPTFKIPFHPPGENRNVFDSASMNEHEIRNNTMAVTKDYEVTSIMRKMVKLNVNFHKKGPKRMFVIPLNH